MTVVSENGSGPILLIIEGCEDHNYEAVPYAVAACRHYFMAGNKKPCIIIQDHLIYTISVSDNWDGTGLP
jgi:hypothetical protein